MKLNVKQLPSGQWAAFSAPNRYYTATVAATEREAKVARLHMIGRDAQDVIDQVDRELRELGALNESDPHGYLA